MSSARLGRVEDRQGEAALGNSSAMDLVEAGDATLQTEMSGTPRLLSPIATMGASLHVSTLKTHSATPSANAQSDEDDMGASLRPYTAADAEDAPTTAQARKTRRKKLPPSRRATLDDQAKPQATREDRPRSAGLNGWGDFNTDRLLAYEAGDSESVVDRDATVGSASHELPPSRARKKRLATTTPATRAGTPGGGRTVTRVLSSRSRPASSCSARPSTPAPLFGPDVGDSPETRALVFERFERLWTLMSRRSAMAAAKAKSPRRSPFECSMAMLKLCQTLGISLASHLSFWYSKEQGVELATFCELVVRAAVQPTLHHFGMDTSVREYLSTLDVIVQSVVTTVSTGHEFVERVREVAEIEPVFPHWRTGLSPQVATASGPHTSASVGDVCSSKAASTRMITAEGVTRAVAASVRQRLLALQLGSEEARVTHEDNLRRKVQLHQSWRVRDSSEAVSSPPLQLAEPSKPSESEMAPLVSDFEPRASHETDPRLRHGHPRPMAQRNANLETEEGRANERTAAREDAEDVLACCLCSVREAVLWCSSCFSVCCRGCWQDVHACRVDMSLVRPEPDRTAPLGPTTLTMRKKRCGSATLTPPVALIYLPIKARVCRTVARRNPIAGHHSAGRRRTNQGTEIVQGEAQAGPMGVFAHAILPALHKSRSDDVLGKRRTGRTPPEGAESTVELVQSLLLRVSPPTPNNTATASRSLSSTGSGGAVKRTIKDASNRPELPMSSVSLDAGVLLLHGPSRQR